MIAHSSGQSVLKKKGQNKNAVDPTVIDEALIIKAVKDYYHENKIVTNEKIFLQSLTTLSLSFKNIWKIQNLDGLNRLERLQLDNNLIEAITCLDHLENLTWLDLSFNCITKITGLEKLKNLTDLSLFNNQISKVEGLGICLKLNVFSIGNNKLESYESIIEVFGKGSKFKHLQVLNVAGNPFTLKEFDYKQRLIISLINLRYLDYVFIDEGMRNDISNEDKFRNEISHENLLKQMEQEEEQERETYRKLKEKELSRMNLVEKMHEELVMDPDLEKMRNLKGIDEEINRFQEKIKEHIENLQKQIIHKNSIKLQNFDKFQKALRHREKESEKETIELLKKFEHNKKTSFRKHEKGDADWKQSLEALNSETQKVKDMLLYVEMSLMEEIERAITEFKNKIEVTRKEMDDINKGIHDQIKIAIKEFSDKFGDMVKSEYERYTAAVNSNSQEALQAWSEDEQNFLDNKEGLNATISNIKDNLNQKAEKKNTDITTLIAKDIDDFILECNERHYERNRKNINNIVTLIEDYRKKINDLLLGDEEDDD